MHTRLIQFTKNILSSFKCELVEMNGEEDHIHILFKAPPQVQLSKLVNRFKTVSSRYIRKEFTEELSKYYWKPYFWSNSYMVFSTGEAPIEIIKQYIENHGQDRSTKTSPKLFQSFRRGIVEHYGSTKYC